MIVRSYFIKGIIIIKAIAIRIYIRTLALLILGMTYRVLRFVAYSL